jgi:hypothetical protein
MIQPNFIDGVDRGTGIRIGGQQNSPGIGLQREGVHKKFRAAYARHALVDKEQRDAIAASGELLHKIHGFIGSVYREYPVVSGEFGLQVPFHGAEDSGIVIQCKNKRLFGHIKKSQNMKFATSMVFALAATGKLKSRSLPGEEDLKKV